MVPQVPHQGGDDLRWLLTVAARHILSHEDAPKFLAWMAEAAPTLAPELFSHAADATVRRALAYAIGRAIWNATPLPGNRYRPRPLPRPERNASCPCGSGAKYKHCCGAAGAPELPLAQETMLAEMLDQLPAARLKDLPHGYLSPEVLGGVAGEWLESGQVARALALLEPLFADVDRLDGRAGYAFDVLADCYNALGKPKKKADFVERVSRARSPELRAAALQRLCTMLADAGRREEAWATFQRAQREFPDHPAHAHLEVTLLLNEGKRAQAAERAHFWLVRMRRANDPQLRDSIEFLERVAADPHAAMMDVSASRIPMLEELTRLVQSVAHAVPTATGRLRCHADGICFYEPDEKTARLEARWHEVFPALSPMLTQNWADDEVAWEPKTAAAWVGFLHATPRALDSLKVLDDIVLALNQLPDAESPWLGAQILGPLLERAWTIFTTVVAKRPEGSRLPWGVLANRPALRLLANLVYLRLRGGDRGQAIPLMEELVYRINPDDNHALRSLLTKAYLEEGRYRDVLDLARRYPDDMMVELIYGRVLALYRLGQHDEAAARAVRRDWPEVYKMLVADNPRPPRLSPYGIRLGGKDQAWLYRREFLPLWREAGALDWLKGIGRKTPAPA